MPQRTGGHPRPAAIERSTVLVAAVLIAWYSGLTVLAVFALHRGWLALRHCRLPDPPPVSVDPSFTPIVTVQLPVYDERFVVRRLLEAVGALEWPRDRLEIQVLDDSTDDTTAEVAAGVARLRAAGVDAKHVRRASRTGYKAGALADGLERARGDIVVLLDADFVPPADLLPRLLAPMRDPGVGVVQARWGHMNRDANVLTRAQALLLDGHFLLETGVRARSGVFFNFHGTAGALRRQAIIDAGGWSADTLTEDLDLSYRAQMAGWRFVFLPDVVVPAELPETLAAFRRQQARWTEGAAATAKKLLGRILRGPFPGTVKREAVLHLCGHAVHPAMLLVALLAVPTMLLRDGGALLWLDALLGLAIILPTRMFYGIAARRAGIRDPGLIWTARLLLIATALSASNTRAAWAGWRRGRGTFERTPKTRGVPVPPAGYRPARTPVLRWLEGGVAAYLACGLVLAAQQGGLGAIPFLGLMAAGFADAAVRG